MSDSSARLKTVFSELFAILRAADYQWSPAKPERLLELRKHGDSYPVLQRCFGLGLPTTPEELEAEGFSRELALEVLSLSVAISRMGDLFIPHSHWPAKLGVDYVYLGEESLELLRLIQGKLDVFQGARVLDLGSGSGALSFEVAGLAKQVLGLDTSVRAVEWSQAAAEAEGFPHLVFKAAPIGGAQAEAEVGAQPWDIAILNPPFAVPTETEHRPHRDGGNLGIELPLAFLQFASRHLRSGGQVFCLVTNPIVAGRPAFFDRLDKRSWQIAEKRCLHDQFNHALYRKERYAERGIQRVELWFLNLVKP